MVFLAVILVIALMIPIVAILVDSPLGRSFARRVEGQPDGGATDVRELRRKVDLLEGEVDELSRSLTATREELQFMQRLLEKPKPTKTS